MAADPESFLPVTPPMFHLLVALVDGPRHGYAIMKEVEERTGGEVRLAAGTLYGLIRRLLAEGLIAEPRRRPVPELDDDERRRYYRLTDLGLAVARAEAARLERTLGVARSKNLLAGPERA